MVCMCVYVCVYNNSLYSTSEMQTTLPTHTVPQSNVRRFTHLIGRTTGEDDGEIFWL